MCGCRPRTPTRQANPARLWCCCAAPTAAATPGPAPAALLAERGCQVLYQSLRGTAGSGGCFDGFVVDPADSDGTLSWLHAQPWFGGELTLWPMTHRFGPGHRVRLRVSSGAHPRFGRDPDTSQPLATGRGLRPSQHEIFHDHSHPSALRLPLTPGAS
ncbi:CocE/NonD family hydrolase C-terminal non-catalytic domain-containing protein [Streptosporangium sp. NPDC023825]|uniref:CocE/NonD family hydrolase C-terminal non-catalytic domain-containing protein n=1 Tax=Streptosporangium sp. NPDC023825 TaxID=3154909 RepID=UPI003420FBD4